MLQVETVTLDRVLGGIALPWRFCKLDLEGGEFRALQGARQVLARSRPVIVFENARAGSAAVYDYSAEEYFAFFGAWTIVSLICSGGISVRQSGTRPAIPGISSA